jgi:hypothetical protein
MFMIWSRWGILAIGIPIILAVVFGFVCEAVVSLSADRPRPTVRESSEADEADQEAIAKRIEDLKAAQREEEANFGRATHRAKGFGFKLGLLAAAGVLWPLGRWMNQSETRMLFDPQSGQMVELVIGGGHTLFFIPIQYWSIIWAVIGVIQLLL